ncbi:hypothetical protein GCM10022206_59220 [Streptomyces chiangmaiensis]
MNYPCKEVITDHGQAFNRRIIVSCDLLQSLRQSHCPLPSATNPQPSLGTSAAEARFFGVARRQVRVTRQPLLAACAIVISYADPGGFLPGMSEQKPKPPITDWVCRLTDPLPGDRDAPPVRLWSSATGADPSDVDFVWSCHLRRFDLEHTFRLFKQSLGWTRPRLRSPEAADRWTWLVITVHTQLRLAAPLATDQRKPWENTTRPGVVLTPTRVRRGFRHIRPHLASPARVPKPSRPGPGRPPGSKNRHPPPAMTWAKPSNARAPSTNETEPDVKDQAERRAARRPGRAGARRGRGGTAAVPGVRCARRRAHALTMGDRALRYALDRIWKPYG